MSEERRKNWKTCHGAPTTNARVIDWAGPLCIQERVSTAVAELLKSKLQLLVEDDSSPTAKLKDPPGK